MKGFLQHSLDGSFSIFFLSVLMWSLLITMGLNPFCLFVCFCGHLHKTPFKTMIWFHFYCVTNGRISSTFSRWLLLYLFSFCSNVLTSYHNESKSFLFVCFCGRLHKNPIQSYDFIQFYCVTNESIFSTSSWWLLLYLFSFFASFLTSYHICIKTFLFACLFVFVDAFIKLPFKTMILFNFTVSQMKAFFQHPLDGSFSIFFLSLLVFSLLTIFVSKPFCLLVCLFLWTPS